MIMEVLHLSCKKKIQIQIYLRREWNQLKSYNPKDKYFWEY